MVDLETKKWDQFKTDLILIQVETGEGLVFAISNPLLLSALPVVLACNPTAF